MQNKDWYDCPCLSILYLLHIPSSSRVLNKEKHGSNEKLMEYNPMMTHKEVHFFEVRIIYTGQ